MQRRRKEERGGVRAGKCQACTYAWKHKKEKKKLSTSVGVTSKTHINTDRGRKGDRETPNCFSHIHYVMITIIDIFLLLLDGIFFFRGERDVFFSFSFLFTVEIGREEG